MNTIILFWNPEISSYTIERLRDDLHSCTHVNNWSVWEHDKAHKGDRFFMVRCGKGKTGICMSGRFRSEPYRGEDWSGKGREVYYMDLMADTVIDPDILPILPTELLAKKIPSFDWTGGHSGRLLPAKDAKKLERLWKKFLENNDAIFYRLTFQTYMGDAELEDEEEKTYSARIELTYEGGFEISAYNPDVYVKGFDLDALKEEFIQKTTEAGNTKPIEYWEDTFGDTDMFFKMMDFAKKAYAGMNDEFGEPYLKLAIREQRGLYTMNMSMVGLLQYVLKNPKITPKKLIKEGIPKEVVDAIVILQQKEGEDFVQYVQRAAENPFAEHVLYQIIEHRLDIRKLPELSSEQFQFLAQNLKAYHYLENNRNTFSGPAKNFGEWYSVRYRGGFAIKGEYDDDEIAYMSEILSNPSFEPFYVDISELNIERWNRDEIFEETYEEEILGRMQDDETVSFLEKLIINRKYGTVFVVDNGIVFCDDGKVLVHLPVDQQLEMPDSVKIIGKCAVACNETIESLELPANVRIIDDYAFAYCKNLRNVFMHDNIESIGEFSFENCEIENLHLSNSLTEIPDCAFLFNEIQHIDIPQNIRRIGSCAFSGNILDEELTIPEGVEVIESESFSCASVKKVSLPSTLTEIAYDFYYEEMIDDSEENKPYVEVHPDNKVYYSNGGILYSRATGKEVLGRAGRK